MLNQLSISVGEWPNMGQPSPATGFFDDMRRDHLTVLPGVAFHVSEFGETLYKRIEGNLVVYIKIPDGGKMDKIRVSFRDLSSDMCWDHDMDTLMYQRIVDQGMSNQRLFDCYAGIPCGFVR